MRSDLERLMGIGSGMGTAAPWECKWLVFACQKSSRQVNAKHCLDYSQYSTFTILKNDDELW